MFNILTICCFLSFFFLFTKNIEAQELVFPKYHNNGKHNNYTKDYNSSFGYSLGDSLIRIEGNNYRKIYIEYYVGKDYLTGYIGIENDTLWVFSKNKREVLCGLKLGYTGNVPDFGDIQGDSLKITEVRYDPILQDSLYTCQLFSKFFNDDEYGIMALSNIVISKKYGFILLKYDSWHTRTSIIYTNYPSRITLKSD